MPARRRAGPRAPGAKLLRDLVAEVRLGSEQVSIAPNPVKLASLLEINGLTEAVTLGDILPASWDEQRRSFGILAQA